MDGHFRAFSFVDRITAFEPGVRIRGEYLIPPAAENFSVSLISEAVGQLAAWAAMAEVNFTHRPVAGIAGSVEILSDVKPGQRVELEVELQSVDTDAAGYSGSAHSNGVPIVRLRNCVGPMVPTDEFDCPEALRRRFELISGAGATPGAFSGLPELKFQLGEFQPGEIAKATLPVPASAPFFTDHFPRRPVFPGTLLMQANLQLAARLATGAGNGHAPAWQPCTIGNVKLRTFIPPGETVQLEARCKERNDAGFVIIVESRIKDRLVGSSEIRIRGGAQ